MSQRVMPTLPLVRAFDAVAEHASLTKAARSLRRSQPALTISMSKLEEMLGVALIERGRSGAHLTAAGEILARRTRRMFDQLVRLARDYPAAGGAAHWTANLTHAQAKCFASLADHDTVERTSAALAITPPSLRRTAQSLEHLIGKPLLIPTAQGVAPTRLGADIARRMKLAFGELEAGVEEIEIAAGRIRTRIAIGVVPLSATRLLNSNHHRFPHRLPGSERFDRARRI
jgi:DNA-binding transcriptional LysR family regulator